MIKAQPEIQGYNTYGGRIFPADFCTDYKGTRNIAARIASDLRFDKQCKQNAENRSTKLLQDTFYGGC